MEPVEFVGAQDSAASNRSEVAQAAPQDKRVLRDLLKHELPTGAELALRRSFGTGYGPCPDIELQAHGLDAPITTEAAVGRALKKSTLGPRPVVARVLLANMPQREVYELALKAASISVRTAVLRELLQASGRWTARLVGFLKGGGHGVGGRRKAKAARAKLRVATARAKARASRQKGALAIRRARAMKSMKA